VHDQLSVLAFVTTSLENAGIPYMITGSIAAGHYARPRFTRGIDVVVELQPEDADRIVQLFGGEFDTDADRIRSAIARRSMFNLIHSTAIVKVDFIVRKEAAYRQQEFSRRRPVTIAGRRMWLVAPEDLVLSKLVWARESRSELQLRDVRELIAMSAALDWRYVEQWATELGVGNLLREVRQ
jgi:hypothetical protein